jgi:thioredoxin reductase (NADPH)
MKESNIDYGVIIIGGGPAAMSAAIYAARAELKVLVLERKYLGGQVAITEKIDNYPGFPEGISGPDLTERMQAHAKRFGVEIKLEEVVSVQLKGEIKQVKSDSATYTSRAIILASGADPNRLNVPGERELTGRGVSYCATCDGPFFRGKKVVVVGGGDAAVQESIFLTRFVTEVNLVHRRDELRAHALLQTEAKSNPKIKFVWNTVAEEILGKEKVEGVRTRNVVTQEKGTMPCEGVFIFIGNAPNTGFIGDALPLCMGGHICTDENMRSQIEGVYAVGDVRGNSYRQIATAVGEGCTAAIAIYHWLQEKQAKERGQSSEVRG